MALGGGLLPYAGYATADLAYGATAHTKQGKTVTDGIVLVTGTEPANWLYPAMTRGAETNIVCVFTRPDPDPAEQSAATRAAPSWPARTCSTPSGPGGPCQRPGRRGGQRARRAGRAGRRPRPAR